MVFISNYLGEKHLTGPFMVEKASIDIQPEGLCIIIFIAHMVHKICYDFFFKLKEVAV